MKDIRVGVALDLLSGIDLSQILPRAGIEMVWRKQGVVRVGFEQAAAESDGGGPSLGLGFIRNRVSFDIARIFWGVSADAGQAPTYLSLRVAF